MLQQSEIYHEFDTGETRYGKSYLAKYKFLQHKGPGVYFNPRRKPIVKTIAVTRQATKTQVLNALRAGEKLNYMLDPDLKTAREDVNRFITILFSYQWPKTLMLVADEVQDFAYQGDIQSGWLRVARTGLGENIKCIFVAQRPADVSKIIVSQCELKTFFMPAQEDLPWLMKMKYPVEEIQKRCPVKYVYVEHFRGQLSAAKKIPYKGEL